MTIQALYEEYIPVEKRRLGSYVFLSLCVHLVLVFLVEVDVGEDGGAFFVSVPEVKLVVVERSFDGISSGEGAWLALRDPRVIAQPKGLPLEAGASLDDEFIEFPLPFLEEGLDMEGGLGDELEVAKVEVYDVAGGAYEEILSQKPSPMVFPVESPARVQDTKVRISGLLSEVAVVYQEAFPNVKSERNIGATHLQVAINQRGWVEHVLVEKSCGDVRVDEIGGDLFQRWRFAARGKAGQAGEEYLWGRVRIFWNVSNEVRGVRGVRGGE